MKNFLSILAVTLLVSTTASAFSLGDVTTDTKTLKMQACLAKEAQKELAKGTLASANIDAKAAEIAAVCAASTSMDVNPEVLKLATKALKSLL